MTARDRKFHGGTGLGFIGCVFTAVLVAGFAGTPSSHGQGLPSGPPSSEQSLSLSNDEVRRQADQLILRMTTEEKIGQLTQSFVYARPTQSEEPIEGRVARGQIGSLVNVLDAAEMDKMQHLAVDKSRLHIPLIFGMDVVHGYQTIFPVPLGMAASWDTDMIEKIQAIAAREAREHGVAWTFAPMLDIAMDPRWGRIVEGAGEDPYLASHIAAAQIKGFQGYGAIDSHHVLACEKHFVGYGASEGGRDHDAANLSESQLRNVYLQPFHAGVDAGVGCVMSAYMDVNDVPVTGNRWLLTDVLRHEWNFQGLVVSDNNAVNDLVPHGFAKDKEDAGVRAIHAGVDMQMSAEGDVSGLLAGARDGRVDLTRLDEAVRKTLEAKILLGLFAHPYVEATVPDGSALDVNREAAKVAAERSAVLLRNEGHLLPLRAGAYRKIAIIGPLADSRQNTLGSWAFAEKIEQVTTVLHGLRANSNGAKINYAQGAQISRELPSPFEPLMKEPAQKPWTDDQAKSEFDRAIALAAESDITIAVLGELQDMSGESASRASLSLPGQQEQLLKSVVALGRPVVLILMNGRPLDIRWATEHVPAILEIWYPGTAGGEAIADLLYGRANPGGKLPLTWPRDANQIPMTYLHTLTQDPENQNKRYWDAPSTPLFPFGFGLSYTTFVYSPVKLAQPDFKIGQPVNLEAVVENTGEMAGDAVVQFYIHQRYGSASRPVRELKGFKRISLQPHESKTLHFMLTPKDLSFWSSAKKDWTQEPSVFDFWVGADSTAALGGSFTVLPD